MRASHGMACRSVKSPILNFDHRHFLPYLQYRHLIPALNEWATRAWYTTACPIACQFPGHGCMDDPIAERGFDSQATWVLGVLGVFFDMLSMGVCTTRHCQTSGRLVQELNVCTVDWTPASAWLYKHPCITYQRGKQSTSMTHVACEPKLR